MNDNRPELSVIIVTHNSRVFLPSLLDSLSEQKRVSIEIIVVDNNSSDDTVDVLSKKYKHVTILQRNSDHGFSAANNLGAANASSDMLLFLNPDISLIKPDDLYKLLEKYKSLKNPGALGPKVILHSSQKIDKTCHRGFPTPWAAFTHFTGLERLFPRSPIFSQYTGSYKGYNSEHPVDSIGGMFMLIDRSTLTSVGGWDEDYPLYGEDIDLCYRLQVAGYENYYWPGVVAMHHKGASTGMSRSSRRVTSANKATTNSVKAWSIEAMRIFYQKHYIKKYPAIVTFIVLVGIKFLKILRTGKI